MTKLHRADGKHNTRYGANVEREIEADGGIGAAPQAAAWAMQGIPTHVVNLDTQAGATQFNDSVAVAGGTGAAINPVDSPALDAALQAVLQAAAGAESCVLDLVGEVTDAHGACARGQVQLDARTLACSDSDGYRFIDGRAIELTGAACDTLQAGAALRATFPCDVVVE